MEINSKYDEMLEKYLIDGINYDANTISKANKGDLEQLAADSYWQGWQDCKSVREQKETKQPSNCNKPAVSNSLNYDWIKINSENDLPTKGTLVCVCRDLIERKQYYTTHWSDEDERYWKLNNIVGWIKVTEFII